MEEKTEQSAVQKENFLDLLIFDWSRLVPKILI
jgi:hypothetical protein